MFCKGHFMITRRQLLVNGIGAGALPLIAKSAPINVLDPVKIRNVSAELGVHVTVLGSVLDRFHEMLPQPAAIIHGSRSLPGKCTFEAGGNAPVEGHWRLDDLGAPSLKRVSLASAVGLGCHGLAARLEKGAVLQYRAGLRMGGLSALLYEGLETRLCLLSRDFPDAPAAPVVFVNS